MSSMSCATINTVQSGKSITSTFGRRNRKSQAGDDGFTSAFNVICHEMEIKNIPVIKVMSTEPLPWLSQHLVPERPSRPTLVASSSDRMSVIKSKLLTHDQSNKIIQQLCDGKDKIYAILNNPENPTGINMLICKNMHMKDDILGALQKVLCKFRTLKILKFEYCNLTSNQLKGVKYLANQLDTLVEVSLDGNPIGYQNFYILLKNTKLLSLSLKFCKINDRGIAKISENLTYPSATTLFAIDLSNNLFTDEGCKSLANALRTNLSLTHLSLADNCLTDTGCTYLIEPLQRFALSHEEVLLRRKCNMEYLLRKKMTISEQRSKRRESSIVKVAEQSKNDKKNRISLSARPKKERASVSSASSMRKSKLKKNISVNEVDITDVEVPKEPHPYMHECIAEEKEIYCKGNFKLTYLNLAYNNITIKGICSIKNMLRYQSVIKTSQQELTGLTKLSLEGNRLGDYKEINDIMELLDEHETVPLASLRKISSSYAKK